MIKKITIKNIGAFEEATVEFERGKTAIIGENGSGKTTLLKSIYMGLTGDSKYILGTNIDEFIRRGEEEGSIEVLFEIAGQDYIIKRSWRRGGRNTASLKTPERRISGITNVTSELERIFRLSTKMLLDITWARQGSIAELLEGDKDVFDRLLGISDLENAWSRLRGIQTDIKKEISAEEKIIDSLSKSIGDEKELKQKIKELNASIESKRIELKNIVLTHDKKNYSKYLQRLVENRAVWESKCSQIYNLPQKGGKCPTCGQKITEDHRKKLQEESV